MARRPSRPERPRPGEVPGPPSPEPGAAPTSEGSSLATRLRARIAREGPIPFAEFMEAALYDPDEGFYSRRVVGEEGEFVTAPHLSRAFGYLVARQVEEFAELLGRPDSLSVIEVGAGDGTLARQILGALRPDVRPSVRYVAVDRSREARRALRGLAAELGSGFEVASSLEEVPTGAVGCVLANEVLDNLPFHRLRGTPSGPVELLVGVEEGRFVLVEGPPAGWLAALAPPLAPGQEAVVSPAALEMVDRAAALLARGYIWIADYGFAEPEERPSVHGYRAHRVEEDVLADPGSRDITAGVDFAALLRHARARGLSTWGPVTQREALLALGFRDWDRAQLARQVEALGAGRGIEALRTYSVRTRANLLLSRGGMGDFLVACLGVGVTAPPRSILGTAR